MMQMVETYTQKNSLLNAMNGFIGAVNNMDQTVMVPSLLRDVPLEHEKEQEQEVSRSPGNNCLRDAEVDMFGYYTQLKAIRNDIQRGALGRAEEMRRKEKESLAQEATRANDNEASEEDVDLEQLFRFHLKGLHGVLSKLTHQANDLTHRYKQEIGIAGWGQ